MDHATRKQKIFILLAIIVVPAMGPWRRGLVSPALIGPSLVGKHDLFPFCRRGSREEPGRLGPDISYVNSETIQTWKQRPRHEEWDACPCGDFIGPVKAPRQYETYLVDDNKSPATWTTFLDGRGFDIGPFWHHSGPATAGDVRE